MRDTITKDGSLALLWLRPTAKKKRVNHFQDSYLQLFFGVLCLKNHKFWVWQGQVVDLVSFCFLPTFGDFSILQNMKVTYLFTIIVSVHIDVYITLGFKPGKV